MKIQHRKQEFPGTKLDASSPALFLCLAQRYAAALQAKLGKNEVDYATHYEGNHWGRLKEAELTRASDTPPG